MVFAKKMRAVARKVGQSGGLVSLHHGDCLEVMRKMDADSVDSIVTDPPAGISFMGKKWDHDKGGRDQWIAWMESIAKECLRVLKPGGHALVWSLPRTSHWTATAWENAGFELRDRIGYIFGTGFPKSHDVRKAIDATLLTGGSHSTNIKQAIAARPGDARETATLPNNGVMSGDRRGGSTNDNLATVEASRWNGWGTALKPAIEDWWLCRKPCSEKTVAANVLKHGTGGLNIDGCRVETSESLNGGAYSKGKQDDGEWGTMHRAVPGVDFVQPTGRFPANLIHDGSEEVLAGFPVTTSGGGNKSGVKERGACHGKYGPPQPDVREVDSGSAARFFYCAKASKSDRGADNKHPTVKPCDLMRYLCRLVTPPNGLILDPFMGSGSTGKAALLEGFRFVGIELEQESFDTASARVGGGAQKTERDVKVAVPIARKISRAVASQM